MTSQQIPTTAAAATATTSINRSVTTSSGCTIANDNDDCSSCALPSNEDSLRTTSTIAITSVDGVLEGRHDSIIDDETNFTARDSIGSSVSHKGGGMSGSKSMSMTPSLQQLQDLSTTTKIPDPATNLLGRWQVRTQQRQGQQLSVVAPSERMPNSSTADFTINKLNFEKLGLYGRDTEKAILQRTIQNMINHTNEEHKQQHQDTNTTMNINHSGSADDNRCQRKQLVFISGDSGVGKSALVKDLLRNTPALRKSISSSSGHGGTTTSNGIMIRGKFDRNIHEPYHGIIDACTDMTSQLLASSSSSSYWSTADNTTNHHRDHHHYPASTHHYSSKRLTQLQESMQHEKDCVSILTHVIPILTEIFPTDIEIRNAHLGRDTTATVRTGTDTGTSNTSSLHAVHNSTETKNRFHQAFRRFIRIVANHFIPFIFVLDDLHWADAPSLELMENILMDRSNSNLLLIGIYRSNEVNERHILTQTINEVRSRSLSTTDNKSTYTMREMELGNLNLDAIHSLVMDVLSTNDIKTLGLAEICHRRTDGNPFFLVLFLKELQRRCLLEFNFGTMQWTWNEEEIEGQMQPTDNVVDLLRSKISEMPAIQYRLLQVASFLGASFHKDVLLLIWMNLHDESEKETQRHKMIAALHALEEEGYFQHPTEFEYKFTHDKILETASSLVPDNERVDLAHAIGTILYRKLDPDRFDSSVFVAVQLLNIGNIPQDESERIELAKLNLKACRLAMNISAFKAATDFVAKGIKLLGTNGWKDNYELMLELHTIGTETESFIGNVERMEEYYTCILAQKDRPTTDKLRAHYVYLGSIAYRGRADEAVKLAMDLLKLFGHTFPKTKLGIMLRTMLEVVKVKKITQKKRIESVVFPPYGKGHHPFAASLDS